MDAVDKEGVTDVLFIFDSPGGSLLESLRLGAYIGNLPATVAAQVGSFEMPGAICASAFVYAYLAADYRYLSQDARIGIHRFGFYDMRLDGNHGAALGQEFSGLLSEYIRRHRAEPELFEAISAIDHNDIRWVSRRELEEWRVVTNNVYDEQAGYINLNGQIALRLSQVARTGESHLTLFCSPQGVSGLADLNEPELAAYGWFEIAIDEDWHSVQAWDVVDHSNARGRFVFDMPLRTAQAAIGARVIGARIVAPSGDIFFGFQQTLRDGLVAEMIRGCLNSRTPANPTTIELPGTDFPGQDLTTDGLRGMSFAACKQICLEHAQCRAVSYVQSRSWCRPKARAGGQRHAPGVISAYKP